VSLTSGGGSFVLPDSSSTNEIQTLSLNSGVISLTSGGGSVTLPDISATNELQSISLAGAIVTLSGSGGSFTLPDSDPANEIQTLSLASGVVSLTSGGSITLPDASSTNEIQTLSISGATISLTSGGSVDVPDDSPWNELQYLWTSSMQTTPTLNIYQWNYVTLPLPVAYFNIYVYGSTPTVRTAYPSSISASFYTSPAELLVDLPGINFFIGSSVVSCSLCSQSGHAGLQINSVGGDLIIQFTDTYYGTYVTPVGYVLYVYCTVLQ